MPEPTATVADGDDVAALRPSWDEQKEMAADLLAEYPDPMDDDKYARGLRVAVNALLYREHPHG